MNPDHVLEIFCGFSGFKPSELHKHTLTIMEDPNEKNQWSHTGSVIMQMNFVSYDQWIKNTKKPDTPCDELMIHALSRIHCRHCLIITSKRTWSTVEEEDNSLTLDELLSICDIRLAYLGDKTFRELQCLPMCAPPPSR